MHQYPQIFILLNLQNYYCELKLFEVLYHTLPMILNRLFTYQILISIQYFNRGLQMLIL